MDKAVLLSLDAEFCGARFSNTVESIGLVAGDAMGLTSRPALRRARINLEPLPGQTRDEYTLNDFWAKFPHLMAETDASRVPAADGMRLFRNFTTSLVNDYENTPGVEIHIVTDCADQDVARLQYLGEATGTWPDSIRSLGAPGHKWHNVMDPSERLSALGQKKLCEDWIQRNAPGVVHDHRPENDAEHSYYQMVFLCRKGADLPDDVKASNRAYFNARAYSRRV